MLEIKLPELGENIAQGTVSKILVKAGDSVKKGQNILEIETDKAVLEVPSPQEGLVKEILIKSGQSVKVGQPIFTFDGKSSAAASSPASEPKITTPAQQPQVTKPQASISPVNPASTTGVITEMKLPGLGENITQGTAPKFLLIKAIPSKKDKTYSNWKQTRPFSRFLLLWMGLLKKY